MHQEWLGLIQPVGLVVAPAALLAAGIVIEETERSRWRTYGSLLGGASGDGELQTVNFGQIAAQVLDWPWEEVAGTMGGPELPSALTIALPELQTQLSPTFAVPAPDGSGGWQLLVKALPPETDLDRASADGAWRASPHDQFERLLRETGVPVGLLVTDQTVRLVYAPRGESSGYLSFPVAAMATVSGRPMFLAMVELLKWHRLSRACPTAARLGTVLRESRKYQNTVSTKLAEQVLGSLYELMRGFQAADEAAGGRIVQETLRESPQEIYGGLLTTIMRMVFVLYAEERGMLPQASSWIENYGLGALYQRLAEDRSRHPDTMDQRFGAWARLLSLTRILHDGADHREVRLPARAGDLFDPDRYPFLEGRPLGTVRVLGDRLAGLPRVSDGVVLRVLERLLVLDGERLSYRALDVEQVGSVYEAMMGFEVRAALGTSIAVVPKSKSKGSPSHPVLDLDVLLSVPGRERTKWLKNQCDCEVPAAQTELLSTATSLDGLLEALQRRLSHFTPLPVRLGGLTLHPTEERRRSGSHYTPRELTEPIVATTMRPILETLGPNVTAEQLLALKVCDPAMGSGAFLVGACRYLGDLVVEAWQRHGTTPEIPLDEDPQLYARRLVAQQCLYGVDRNPYAVALAKLSLWLVTLAKDHPFTFVDHALRHGDSLVGLTRRQIQTFTWKPGGGEEMQFWSPRIDEWLESADETRDTLEGLAASDDTREKQELLTRADGLLERVRQVGDAIVAAYFRAAKPRERMQLRGRHEELVAHALEKEISAELDSLLVELESHGIVPFHWEVEYPEVFARERPGFDAIVGNPPFAGKNTLISSNPEHYLTWLQTLHADAHGNADLVAHFFRRAFHLLRLGGAFGLIATNTIAQGDTRASGLRWLCQHGGTLYEARRRYRWPGLAAVVVSVVHGVKGSYSGTKQIDGAPVDRITAFLFHTGNDDDPAELSVNAEQCFVGSYLLGMGFVFADGDEEATPTAVMQRLIAEEPKNQNVIFPYMGGGELNESPALEPSRYAINFGAMTEEEARSGWPSLLAIVETKVRPLRDRGNRDSRKKYWWQFAEKAVNLYAACDSSSTVLVRSLTSAHFSAFAFLPAGWVYDQTLIVWPRGSYPLMSVLASSVHECWATFVGGSLGETNRYNLRLCFETFPFPIGWHSAEDLANAGRAYHDFRAQLMVSRGEGLTDIYNRFHDPMELSDDIRHFRELHAAMDHQVLMAYGWIDLPTQTDFIPDFDEEEIEPGSRAIRKYRLRWPDDIRDEVLARLLELNRQRAIEQGVT